MIDLATGETILTSNLNRGAPAADTFVGFRNGSVIVTDPATEKVLMTIPVETFREAQQQTVTSTPDEPDGGPDTDLRMLASTDGDRFLLEDLRSSDPDSDPQAGTVGVSTNGSVALVRFGDEWIRYDVDR